MPDQQRRTDPRWTPDGVPEQHPYRNTAPGWGQVHQTPRSTTEIAHNVIHTIEHSTLLRVVRSSRAVPVMDLSEHPSADGSAGDWEDDAVHLAALVDGAIRNLLPVTGNPTITRIRGYLADLRSRLLSRDVAGIAGAVQSITAALASPAATTAPAKANSAGDISSLDAIAQAALRLLQRAGHRPGSAPTRPTNPRVRQFRGE